MRRDDLCSEKRQSKGERPTSSGYVNQEAVHVGYHLDEVWNGAPLRSCRTFLTNFGPVQNGDSVCENVCTAVPSHA